MIRRIWPDLRVMAVPVRGWRIVVPWSSKEVVVSILDGYLEVWLWNLNLDLL